MTRTFELHSKSDGSNHLSGKGTLDLLLHWNWWC